jgi:predicted nucleic acid-binding protein
MHPRITIEALAVVGIIETAREKDWKIYSSDPLRYELVKMGHKLHSALSAHHDVTHWYEDDSTLKVTDQTKGLAVVNRNYGIGPMDSVHLSVAQASSIDVFLALDRNFLLLAKARQGQIKDSPMRIAHPLDFFLEITHGN